MSEQDPHQKPGILVIIRNRILTGLFVAIPLLVTVYIILFVYGLVSKFVRKIFSPILLIFFQEFMGKKTMSPDSWELSAAGIFVTLLMFFLLGIFATQVIGRRLGQLIDKMILRLPMIKTIYQLTKQLVEAFGALGKMKGSKVVYVTIPGSSVRLVGLITGEYYDPLKKCRMFTVTPNPATGFVFAIEESGIEPCPMSFEEAIKLIASAGLVTPKYMTSSGNAATEKSQ